jgi:hypothetical protein
MSFIINGDMPSTAGVVRNVVVLRRWEVIAKEQ